MPVTDENRAAYEALAESLMTLSGLALAQAQLALSHTGLGGTDPFSHALHTLLSLTEREVERAHEASGVVWRCLGGKP